MKNQRKLIRLNKYIADSGITSRRKSEELILQNRVAVNDNIINDLAFKIDPGKDKVLLDGEVIQPKRHIYILLNKPKGVVTTTSDEKNRKTVVDLIKTNERIYPVGRLDYNTTGVLLLTNDGDFSNFLTHPSNNIPRNYEVKLDKPLEITDIDKLLNGIYIAGKKGRFIRVNFPNKKNRRIVEVKSTEGRNHFVKNMFGAIGYKVTGLNRREFAGLKTDQPPGKYRNLSQEEIRNIKIKYAK